MSVPQPPSAVFVDAGGVLLLPAFDVLVKHFELEDPSFDELYHAYFTSFEQHDLNEPEAKWLWTAFLQQFGKHDEAIAELIAPLVSGEMDAWGAAPVAAPGAVQFLQVLEQAKIPTVVVSNAKGTVDQLLMDAGVCQAGFGSLTSVTAVVDSHIVGVRKPDPRIFRFAREAATTFSGEELNLADCVHIGDALWSDVRGAESAGIPVVHLDPTGLCTEASMHCHASDLAGVLDVLGISVTPAKAGVQDSRASQ